MPHNSDLTSSLSHLKAHLAGSAHNARNNECASEGGYAATRAEDSGKLQVEDVVEPKRKRSRRGRKKHHQRAGGSPNHRVDTKLEQKRCNNTASTNAQQPCTRYMCTA